MTAALYNGGSHNVKRMLAGLIRTLPETEKYMRKVPATRRRLDSVIAGRWSADVAVGRAYARDVSSRERVRVRRAVTSARAARQRSAAPPAIPLGAVCAPPRLRALPVINRAPR